MTQQKQKAVNNLLTAQLEVSEFKKEHAVMVESIMRDFVWAKVGPKQPLMMDIVNKIQELGTALNTAKQVQ